MVLKQSRISMLGYENKTEVWIHVCPPHNRHALPSIICLKQKVDPCLFFLVAIFSMTLPPIHPVPFIPSISTELLIIATQNMRSFYLFSVRSIFNIFVRKQFYTICPREKTSNKQDLFIKLKKKLFAQSENRIILNYLKTNTNRTIY